MNAPGWLLKLAGSRHAGRAVKAAKVLNALGTIRGAVTTAAVIASAAGGLFTVQTVRGDLAADHSALPKRPGPARSVAPSLDASSLVLEAQRRLLAALDSDNAAIDDLRKVAVISPAQLDALIAEAQSRLRARYDQAQAQVAQLVGPWQSPDASAAPTPSFSIVALNALVSVAAADMSAIVFNATKVATTAPPSVRPTPFPTRTPLPTPTHTPTPTPPRTPTPTPKL